MRIAIATETYSPTGGGAERSVVQIATHLARRGHDVTVFAGCVPSDAGEAVERSGVAVEAFGSRRLKQSGSLRRFAGWATSALDSSGADVTLSGTMAVPAMVVQPRGGTVRETQLRNVAMRRSILARLGKRLQFAVSAKQRALLALERATIDDARVRRFVAVSRYVAEQFRKHYGVSDERIDVLPNAAEAPLIDEADRAPRRSAVRRQYDIGDDALVYVFAALNPRLKGIEPLMHAMQRVHASKPEAVLVVAGSRAPLVTGLVDRLGLTACVRVVGPTDVMADLFAAVDVTVLPSFYDPSSKVVIESLMMGVPAISTRYNGASDMIDGPGVTEPRGRVIDDPWDIEVLTGAMLDLADAGSRERCSAATEGLADDLSMARHVERLEAVFEEVAADTPASR